MFQHVKTHRRTIIAILILFAAGNAKTQPVDTTKGNDGIVPKVWSGLVQSLAWYDIPVAAADLAELAFIPSNATGKLIRYPATTFDSEFQSHVGVHGLQTFIARMGDAGFATVFGVRILANVGSDLVGGNVTSEDYHRTFWFYKSLIYTYSMTELAKNLVYRARPDGSDGQSFFSGHSSLSFCAASYLSPELNDWFDRWDQTKTDDNLRLTLKISSTLALYAGATYVAYSRLHDEKHYFTDVAVGAAVGTAMGTLMYHWHWDSGSSASQDVSLCVVRGTPMISYAVQF